MAALTICTCLLRIKDQLGAAFSQAELVFEPRKSQVHTADSLYLNKQVRSQASPSIAIQDITYVSKDPTNTLITIIYNNTATAGSETVVVTLNAIVIGIQSGVSTALQIQTAVLASVAASVLVDPIMSGASSNTQTFFTPAVLLSDYVCVLKLSETTTDAQLSVFTLNWYGSSYNSIIFDPIQVPNQAYLDLSTMLTVSRG